MTIEVSGRNYEITGRIRKLIETKISKVLKYFQDIIEVRCVLKVEKYRNICEITIKGKNYDVKSIQEASSMEEAIAVTIDHLKLQASKNRTKIRDHKRPKGTAAGKWPAPISESTAKGVDHDRPQIIRGTRAAVRNMSIDQAAMTLDDSKKELIVFRDLDSNKVSILYRRRDKNFGLVTPDV